MNIKQIADKIIKEADINQDEYTIADRIDDINSKYFQLIEWATQIGSTEAISNKEVHNEDFTLVEGDNTLDRVIIDVPIYSIEYSSDTVVTADSNFYPLEMEDGYHYCGCGLEVELTEKQIILKDASAGTLRLRYARGTIVPFTLADYSLTPPPSPTWLPVIFHDLLWLEPATTQADYYKKDRSVALHNKLTKLEGLFYNHYLRNANQVSAVRTNRKRNNR